MPARGCRNFAVSVLAPDLSFKWISRGGRPLFLQFKLPIELGRAGRMWTLSIIAVTVS